MHFLVIKIGNTFIMQEIIAKKIFSEIFEVADYETAVKIWKLKIADSIWRPFMTKFHVYWWTIPINN